MRLRYWAASCMVAAAIASTGLGQASQPATAPAVAPEEIARRISAIRQRYAASADRLSVGKVRLTSAAVPLFSRIEARFDLTASYSSPFDPEQINVEAIITRPDGKTIVVPAFFSDTYEPISGQTQMTVDVAYRHVGPAGWSVRYAPDRVGEYRVTIRAKDARGREARSPEARFAAQTSENKGFVQVSRTNPMYFENSADNSLFFAVGSNVAWTRLDEVKKGIKGDASYEHYFGRAQGKINATRVWLCHWAWLEWTPQKENNVWPDYGGANHYNQMISTAMDRVFELAEAQGLRIMLVTEDNNELFTQGWNAGIWAGHPYNVTNGGPCVNPNDIFVDEQARKLYRNRLRYIIARWGYSPSLWAINSLNDYNAPTPGTLAWIKEVRNFVHDVVGEWRPIIYGSNVRFEANQYTDYRQAMGQPDPGEPNVIQECFYTPVASLFRQELHEQLWSGFARGLAGIMVWDHTLVDRTDSWDEFAPLMRFADGLPLNRQPWKRIAAKVTSATASASGPFIRAAVMSPYGDVPRWGARAPKDRFEVDLDEKNAWLEGFAAMTYAPKHAAWRTEPIFIFDMPADGKFLIEAREIGSGSNTMHVYGRADENDPWREIATKSFEGGRRELREEEQWIEVPVAKGAQQVKFSAAGDWIRVNRIVILHEFPSANALVEASGWTDGENAFLYVLNQSHSRMLADTFKQKAVDMSDVVMNVAGLNDGDYKVQAVSTADGSTVSAIRGTSKSGALEIRIPRLSRDLAIRITAEQ